MFGDVDPYTYVQQRALKTYTLYDYPNQFTSGSQAVRESPLANSADVNHTHQKPNTTAHSPYPLYIHMCIPVYRQLLAIS